MNVSYNGLLSTSFSNNDSIKDIESDESIDSSVMEAEEGMNELKFIDTYDKLDQLNRNSKIITINKILMTYGSKNKSLETFCERSLEAEATNNATAPTNNTNNNSNQTNNNNGANSSNTNGTNGANNNANDPKKAEKSKKISEWISNVVSAIIKALRNFFSMIKDKIIQFSAWINKAILHKDTTAENIAVNPNDAFTYNQMNYANSLKLVDLYKQNVSTLIQMGNNVSTVANNAAQNNNNNSTATPSTNNNQNNGKSQEILNKLVEFLKAIPNIKIDTGALGSPDAWKKISEFKINYSDNRNDLITFFVGAKKVKGDRPLIKNCFGTGETDKIAEMVKKISGTFSDILKQIEGPFNEANKFCDKIQNEWKNAPSNPNNSDAIVKERQNVLMCLKMLCRLQETISKVFMDVINIVHNASIRVTETNKVDAKQKENAANKQNNNNKKNKKK